MALTPAEKQRRYRERHKDRPTSAQQIRMLTDRIAQLEAQLRGDPCDAPITLKNIDLTIIDQWETALGRKKKS